LNFGCERGSGDGNDVLTFVEIMFGNIRISFNDEFNECLSLSICGRRSFDGGEGEEEGCERRGDK